MNTKEQFKKIYSDLKQRFLSREYFPKLIIGTGLSVSMGIPGMVELGEELNIKLSSHQKFGQIWQKYGNQIKNMGLENALSKITYEDFDIVNEIRTITSKYILTKDIVLHNSILTQDYPFERLLKYLSNTVSCNNKLIDIMTPNYDRIIEILCDKIGLISTSGFIGNIYKVFNYEALNKPYSIYNKEQCLVRIFKPHGSINWIKKNNEVYQIDDSIYLENNYNIINIIPPGNNKYKDGMETYIYSKHREIFNSLINSTKNNFSLIIYGYGFNDEHFNNAIFAVDKDILVITKELNQKVFDIAINRKNWVLIYENIIGKPRDVKANIVYDKQVYQIDEELWDLNSFVQKIIS